MKPWKKRSKETQALLNPAFCGEIIRLSVWSYQKSSKNGMPISLVFLILPIILHEETIKRIPSRTEYGFHVWLENNQIILVDLAERTKKLLPITQEALLFLSKNSTIKIKNDKISFENFKHIAIDESDRFVAKYYFRTRALGEWFAKAGKVSTIFNLLGVKP